MSTESYPSTDSNNHDELIDSLKNGHYRFLNGLSIHPHASQDYRIDLASAQHPQIAILSCSDSRVPVELLFDSGFGDLFVIRNAGAAFTYGSLASLEYAVLALNVKLIVVLGHEGCGAVKAACGCHENLTPALAHFVHHITHQLISSVGSLSLDTAFFDYPRITQRELISASALFRERISSGELRFLVGCYMLGNGQIEWLSDEFVSSL